MKPTVVLALLVMTLAAPTVCFASNAIQPVPEPASGLLLLMAGAGVAAYRKFRARR
jgi:hypothetical protein